MAGRRSAPTSGMSAGLALARPWYVLPVIVLSQFAGSSLWFAGNAVVADLPPAWGVADDSVSAVTSAVQLGFIAGTLLFAFLSVADRFSPRWVFLVSALAGALCSASLLLIPESLEALLLSRFATGFFLAGIYPVGMKIAASWYAEGLGRALGYLVGALVLGTAFPHLLRAVGADYDWQFVIAFVSALAAAGGVMMWRLVPDGPHLPKGSPFDPRAIQKVFRSREFRASAFGYFGHMWELYAFWAFLPVWLAACLVQGGGAAPVTSAEVAWWSFAVIAAGALGCVAGGVLSARLGSPRVAAAQLAASGICCVLSPLIFVLPPAAVLVLLLVWGVAVVGDSPQFSALNAQTAPREYVGSALTIANCAGFLITVFSLQLLGWLLSAESIRYLFVLLAVGPLLGLMALRPLLRGRPAAD